MSVIRHFSKDIEMKEPQLTINYKYNLYNFFCLKNCGSYIFVFFNMKKQFAYSKIFNILSYLYLNSNKINKQILLNICSLLFLLRNSWVIFKHLI